MLERVFWMWCGCCTSELTVQGLRTRLAQDQASEMSGSVGEAGHKATQGLMAAGGRRVIFFTGVVFSGKLLSLKLNDNPNSCPWLNSVSHNKAKNKQTKKDMKVKEGSGRRKGLVRVGGKNDFTLYT